MSNERTPAEAVILDRAKAKLMAVLGWDEPLAHYYLQRGAMDRQWKRVRFAHMILACRKHQVRDMTKDLKWVSILVAGLRTPAQLSP